MDIWQVSKSWGLMCVLLAGLALLLKANMPVRSNTAPSGTGAWRAACVFLPGKGTLPPTPGSAGSHAQHRTAFGLDPRRRRPAGRRLALRTAQCGLGAGIASHSSGGSLEQAGPPLVSGQADATASTAPHPACPVVSPSATTSPWPRNRTTSTAAASARPRRSETSSSPLPRPAPHCSKKGLGRVPRATALASSVSQHVFRNWAFRGRFKTQPRAQKQLRKKQRPTLTAGSLAGSWKDFARW